ncbi:hypothetical protein [Priestia megaterium]|uniref:hypothetical protein n=1 Tax=Priestia megaterium TaxID=1404 RepID=UPI0015D4E735|nr:hypothetical protein [Priestia megaterium]
MEGDQKLYFFLGYLHAQAESLSRELGMPIDATKEILLEKLLQKRMESLFTIGWH